MDRLGVASYVTPRVGQLSKERVMKISIIGAIILAATAAPAVVAAAPAQSAQHAQGTIVDAAAASGQHTTLVAAVKAADLAGTLSSPGPFTVFAPSDAAFAKLPAGTVDTLLRPENKSMLASILTYHVVPGRVDAATLSRQINAGGGQATLTTVQGGTLVASITDDKVTLRDAKGGISTVTAADLIQSNGLIHVTDSVSMPS